MTLEIGEKFSSFKELQHRIAEFEKNNYVHLYITDSKTIKYAASANPRLGVNANKALVYIYVVYSCAQGGRRVRAFNTGRPSFTQGCPMRLRFKLDDDGQYLVLHKGLEEHNHEVGPALYSQMSQNCRSDDSFKPRNGPRLKGGRKRMQKHFQKKTNGRRSVIVLKNLNNSRGRMQNDLGRNDFHSVIYKLQQRNDATVEAVVNDYKVLQGLFFQDYAMKSSFEAFPEVLLIETSHLITNVQMPYLYLFLTVDGNGEYEIVAVLLMANETQLLIEKMISIFKDYNSRWNEVLVIMTDRKLKEKDIFQKEFPSAPVILNVFGILQLFQREITCENMSLNKVQCEDFLEIVKKLIYSNSDKQYRENYELLSAGPQHLIDYYVNNWHPLRSEWIEGFKMIHPELETETNNRLESMNEKLKEICDKSSSFLIFFDKLFCMLSSLALEADLRALNSYEKLPIQDLKPGSIEELYYEVLTPYAFSLIKQQFALCGEVELPSGEITCKIVSCGKEIEVSANTCDCSFVRSTGLPCRHIFAIRQKNQLSLYDDNLVPQRWTALLYKDKHRVFKVLEQLERNWVQIPGSNDIVKSEQHRYCYKIAALVAHELAILASQTSDSTFDERITLMRQLLSAWKTDRAVSLTVETKETKEGLEAMDTKDVKTEPLPESYSNNK